MYVKNINGSSRFPAPAGYTSWLNYWECKSGQKASSCSANNCDGKDLVGAHVQMAYGNDQSWYIVPLCKSCNQKTGTFNVNATLVPVPSNL